MDHRTDKRHGKFSFETGPDGETQKRVTDILLRINEAIPEGSNAGEVCGAIGRLMIVGFENCYPAEDRLKAFDEWMAWHRQEIIKKIN